MGNWDPALKKAAYNRWRTAHIEQERARCREYYHAHKERRSKEWKKYYEQNKERLLEKGREYRLNNPEKIRNLNKKNYRDEVEREIKRSAAWKKANPEKVRLTRNQYLKKRRETDPAFKMLTTLRNRLVSALKKAGAARAARTTTLLGCSISKFRTYLESKFQPGMTWENHGCEGWHIDHIIPCAAFDLTDPEQQKKCFHWSNLQPLWAADNIRKGAHYGK